MYLKLLLLISNLHY